MVGRTGAGPARITRSALDRVRGEAGRLVRQSCYLQAAEATVRELVALLVWQHGADHPEVAEARKLLDDFP
ncbi:hypothetical protein ACN27F_23960 [Solwaraspora sp. WMMB335]|uniref:hypothetical protein n=1 Tax=Solwaraspora sp. WMMB335 TaxID=3404118 RepID=UPI003B9544CD